MIALMNSPAMRSLFWRLGRRLYGWARREVSSGFETSGEHWLLQGVLADADRNKSTIFLDIGAHMGIWSESATSLLVRQKAPGYAFEPASSTFAYLSEKFKGSDLVSMNRIALSDQSGEQEFFIAESQVGK